MTTPLTLKTVSDTTELTARMSAGGLNQKAIEYKTPLFAACAEKLIDAGLDAQTPIEAFFVPGRIEVLGKHTDYNGGRSILAAVDKGFCIIAAKRNDNIIRIFNVAGDEQAKFPFSHDITQQQGHWSNYPMTAVKRLAKNFPESLHGADIAFLSDLPPASGMSSSSAMIVGFFLTLATINDISSQPQYKSNIANTDQLAEYLGSVENGLNFKALAGDEGVGTFGGSEDHTAVLCCKPHSLSQYSYSPIKFERLLDVPDKYIFAVASSGVVSEKTGAAMEKYNRVSLLCRCAVEIWNKATGRSDKHLAGAIASSDDAPDKMRQILKDSCDDRYSAEDLLRRFEHFLVESETIIPVASDALAEGDMDEFAKQVDLSQEYTETKLLNMVPETVFLAKTARQLGATAASAFGAGFGGSVWALVEVEKSEAFLAEWSEKYKQQFPEAAAAPSAMFLLTRPGPAAFEL